MTATVNPLVADLPSFKMPTPSARAIILVATCAPFDVQLPRPNVQGFSVATSRFSMESSEVRDLDNST